ncbi:hypothetical protein ACFVVP_26250 [Streptomyces sp. NPDC058128]|uniref:hypothetical protein n=1 Tax=Streptomyces sp. NPDC058128 TaxID=3346352 RepID=UPI0036ED73B8
MSHCRHLLEGYTAARVARPQQWGGTVVPVQRTEVPYGSAQLGWTLAERAIVKLTGVRAVDLAAEAEQAGLRAAGSRR